MIHPPIFCHHQDDDYAPLDYSYVPSVSEGQRKQQERNIHPDAQPRADAPRPHAHIDASMRGASLGRVMKELPSSANGPAPAASAAYPEDYGIPENPFDPPAQATAPPRATIPDPAPAVIVAQDGSEYDAPLTPDMPEWLRVAQHNHMTTDERRTRAPLVRTAPNVEQEAPQTDMLGRPLHHQSARPRRAAGALPQTAEEYEEAGYPPELLAQQQMLEKRRDEIGLRRRHGAQHAVNQGVQEAYRHGTDVGSRQSASYPPPRQETMRRRAQPSAEIPESGARPPQGYGEGGPGSRGAAYASAAAQDARAYPRRQAPINAEFNGSSYALGQELNAYAMPDRRAQSSLDEPWPVEDEAEADTPARRIPWLGISAFAAAFLAAGLWLLQLTFSSQLTELMNERQAAADSLRNNHPYGYEELIEREAEKNNLNPAFVAAIVLNESSFNPKAESRVGARGLMQLMDDTAGWAHGKMGLQSDYSFDDMYNAETNVQFGCWYLNFLSERFRGDPILVAAAFHAGQGEVQNWLNDARYSDDGLTLKLENMVEGPTKQYATRVVRAYSIYKRLYYQDAEGRDI